MLQKKYNFFQKIFSINYERGSLISSGYPLKLRIYILGLSIVFNLNKSLFNRIPKALYKCCDIENLDYILEQGTQIPHMTGIVINGDVKIGKNCRIQQNVTLGQGKYNSETRRNYPIIGDNVMIGAGAIVIGGITVGNNVIIGAGSVVVKDIPDNATVVGNPARVIRVRE